VEVFQQEIATDVLINSIRNAFCFKQAYGLLIVLPNCSNKEFYKELESRPSFSKEGFH